MKKIWVLLKEYNDYDQHGSYFLAAFLTKPTAEQIREVTDGLKETTIAHILAGGGREACEYEWFLLEEVIPGRVYQ